MRLKSYLSTLSLLLLLSFILPKPYPSSAAHAANAADETAGDNSGLISIIEAMESSGPDDAVIKELKAYADRNLASSDEALLTLARAHYQRKEFKDAEAAYRRLVQGFPTSSFRIEALFELGSLLYKSNKTAEAKEHLRAVISSAGASISLKARATLALKDMDAIPADMYDLPAIGALVPLEGNYRGFGEQALSGVLLAAGVFGDLNPGVEVIVRNVGADADSPLASIAELSGNKRVLGVVGPLLSSTVSEAAKYAQAKRMPMIALSQKEGVTEAGDYVFRSFFTPNMQATALAGYACKKLGLKSFAILYPESNYGAEFARLFEKEVTVAGGNVVRQASYPAGATDFSQAIKQIFGIQVKEKKEGRRQIREYTQTVQVDAIFVPDAYEVVSLVAPYLKYYDTEPVQVLGTNAWNSERFMEGAGPDMEGAIFADGFFAESARKETMEFSRRFFGAYGRKPGLLEAEAYDATRAVISAIGQAEAEGLDREAVKYRLKATKDILGSSGVISFNQKGEAQKRPFILMIKDGRIVEAPGS